MDPLILVLLATVMHNRRGDAETGRHGDLMRFFKNYFKKVNRQIAPSK